MGTSPIDLQTIARRNAVIFSDLIKLYIIYIYGYLRLID